MLFSMVAGGNIAPARFVKQSTTADHKCLLAGANAVPIGISQRGTRNTPYSSLDDGYAAIDGENIQIHGLGDTAILECGGTVAAGDRLKADASGKGVACTSASGDNYGAIASEAGTDGKLIEVQVQIGTWGEA